MEGTAQSGTPTYNRTTLVAVLLSGAFAAILNQTLLATAIPEIMHDLNITENTAQWLQSIFMLVNGIMIPITAFLIETFTTRRLFLASMALFVLGTLLCAIAPNFLVLLSGRVVQAAGAGIMMPLMQTIFLYIFPVEKRGSAMGMVGLIIGFAPAIGPTLSGWVVEHFDWRFLFYIILPIAILDLILAYFLLKNVTEQTYPKVDYFSIVLSTLGFGGILYGFSMAGEAGWTSSHVVIGILVGAIALVFFILRQFKLEQPILEFRVFKYNMFTLTTILGSIVFISMIGAAVVLPIYMQNMAHFSPLQSGLMLLPGAIIVGAMSPITGRIFDRVGAKWLAIIGLFIVTVTTFLFTNLSTETTFTFLTIAHAIRMLGVSMVMMPVTTAGLNQLPYRLIPHGTAMNNTIRQVAGSVGTALLVTVMTTGATSNTDEGHIDGVNLSFFIAFVFSAIAFVMAFFIKKTSPEEEEQGGRS